MPLRLSHSREQSTSLTQGDHQAQFYENYRKLAEEFDKEFLKKHEEDLDTTLIFAGLFSAVTSAFIIQVDSQLKPDPGDETAALLRVLIYKIDNTAFGNNVPALPQPWIGPPRAMVHVQAILFASLATSLFSAFLAMLGKQWLNRYSSVDVRGTMIERCKNRQRKLDGIVVWYFDHVMGLLPLMLQAALLLLGCALSKYLWNIDIIVASVVLGATSSGVALYLFILIAGATWGSCPYQTPGSRALRYLAPAIISHVGSAIVGLFEGSEVAEAARLSASYYRHGDRCKAMIVFSIGTLEALAIDVFQFLMWPEKFVVKRLVAARAQTLRLIRGVYRRLRSRTQTQTKASDLRCISWIFQTSLDNAVHMSAFNYLASIPKPDNLPALVAGCFRIFASCITANQGEVVVTPGLERLAILSAGGFFRTLLLLMAIDPTSSVPALEDLRRSHSRMFSYASGFVTPQFNTTMTIANRFVCQPKNPSDLRWHSCALSSEERIILALNMQEAAQVAYQRIQRGKVPRWILRFVLDSLSLDPPPPVPVIINCLEIVAIDLGYDLSDITVMEESARMGQVSNLIIQGIRSYTASTLANRILPKAISALLPYALRLGRDGQQEMVDAILCATGTPGLQKSVWHHVPRYIATLFGKPSFPSLDREIVLLSPCVPWGDLPHGEAAAAVAGLATSASAVPYVEEIGQSVVDALLQIASFNTLRSHIPINLWAWLNNQPTLPPECRGRLVGFNDDVIRHVRGLGGIEILKSYFLLVWSEWQYIHRSDESKISIRQDFGSMWMRHHREDLIKRLNHVVGELDREPEYFSQRGFWPEDPTRDGIRATKKLYGELRDILLEVDRMETFDLAQSSPSLSSAQPLPLP